MAVIVPAYNEAGRIRRVLSVVRQVEVLDEILVVDDGSTDATLDQIPRGDGIRTISLGRNRGKGGAMQTGVAHTQADIILFLDADLVGLTPSQVEDLVVPLLRDEADMAIGLFRAGRAWTDLGQRLVPYISGQRAVRRGFFLDLPDLGTTRAGVEVALTYHAKRQGLRVCHVPLTGVTHVMKEEKLGLWRGSRARLRMYWEITRYVLSQSARARARSFYLRLNGKLPASGNGG